mgnify:CR=1 FL=1
MVLRQKTSIIEYQTEYLHSIQTDLKPHLLYYILMRMLNDLYSELSNYPSPKKFLNKLPDSIDVLGVGSARLVIQDPHNSNNVIKMGVGRGINQNKNEVKVLEQARKKNISNILLPILDTGENDKWIKMPKVSADSSLEKLSGPNSREIYDILEKNGITLYELETCNFNEDYVAFDYGAVKNIQGL